MNREQYLNKMRAHSLTKPGLLVAVHTHNDQEEMPQPVAPVIANTTRKTKKNSKAVALAA